MAQRPLSQVLADYPALRGPKGDTGDQGPAGPSGTPGAQGSTGAAGAPGSAGAKGDKGDTGATGPQGPQGPAGTNGSNGSSGLSAYQVAVAAGFVGTQAAWLASLTGAQGPQGNAGATGSQGPQGNTGPAGSDAVVSTAHAAPYRTILNSSGSHTAAKAAGTYAMGQGDPLAVSGTGTLYPINLLYIDPADYPNIGALTAKMRLRCGLFANDVAPTGNFTFGLYPVTRPGTSGGAGLDIFTLGTVVPGSTVVVNTPAADSANNAVGTDFAVPSAGFYCIGVVTTAAVATSSHLHMTAALQLHHA